MAEKTIWGIHAGKGGAADNLFMSKNVVAIGWYEMGDLSSLKTREQLKDAYPQHYPNAKPGAIPVDAGQLHRFLYEMATGDLVAYPSPITREIHIGEIIGDYQYCPDISDRYPNQRKVKWLKSVPRTSFSQGALYEIGSAMTLFQIRNYTEEYFLALEGQLEKAGQEEDITVPLVASEIEELTRDFVLKQLSKNLKGLPFEEFVVHLLEKMGYKARLTPPNTPNVDIIAHKDELGFQPPIIKVQVKTSDGNIGDKDVAALCGNLRHGEFGLVITLGGFTDNAVRQADSRSDLRLIDGTELVDLVFEYYEKFDSKYKSIIPLKNMYIPEGIEKEEG